MEVNKHLDCSWLCETKKGTYSCCDCRSENQGKAFTPADAEGQACPFFHPKNKRNEFFMIGNKFNSEGIPGLQPSQV